MTRHNLTDDVDPQSLNIVAACADLVGRSGARGFEIGYLHDDMPPEQAGWYASASYRGTRLQVEDQPGPEQAAMALAVRILTGARCRCGRLVTLHADRAAVAFDNATMADGSTWNAQQARDAGQCLWRLEGLQWKPSCPIPTDRRRGPL